MRSAGPKRAIVWFLPLLIGLSLAGAIRPAVAIDPLKQPDGTLVFERQGVVMAAIPTSEKTRAGLAIMPAKEGIEALVSAFDGLWESSAYAREAIGRLKRAGEVQIVYDPRFPPGESASLTLAALLPDFYEPAQGKRLLLVLVSRYGIKWDRVDLIATLAHELLGHGIQHIDGYLTQVRRIDLECGAELFSEAVYQGLKVNKRHTKIVKFRRTLESHWCRPFKQYQAKHAPESLELWKSLNPDVPGLLAHLNAYYKQQIDSGLGAATWEFDKQVTLRRYIDDVRRTEGTGAGKVLFEAAVVNRDGLGGVKRDREKARILFDAAAESGHPTAAAEAEKLK